MNGPVEIGVNLVAADDARDEPLLIVGTQVPVLLLPVDRLQDLVQEPEGDLRVDMSLEGIDRLMSLLDYDAIACIPRTADTEIAFIGSHCNPTKVTMNKGTSDPQSIKSIVR